MDWEGKSNPKSETVGLDLLDTRKRAPETVQMPEGETIQDVWARSVTSWQEIKGLKPRRPPRGGPRRCQQNHPCDLLGLTPADIWAVKQGNGGVTVVDINPDPSQPAVVTRLNLTSTSGGDRPDRRGRPLTHARLLLLDPVRILHGPGTEPSRVLLSTESGVLSGFGDEVRRQLPSLEFKDRSTPAAVGPCPVDPHTVLPIDQRPLNHPQPASLRSRRGVWPGGTAAARTELRISRNA